MKPLNRPMFKYGGPIKEGIMSGMKDNRQAINTVGSPLAPTDSSGRQGYAGPLLPLIYSGLATAGRFALRPLGKFVSRKIGPGTFTQPKKYLGYSEYGMPITQAAKTIPKAGPTGNVNIFQPNVVGKYLMQSPEGRFLMGASGKAGAAGKKVGGAAKSLAKSPLTVGSVLYYGGGALLPDGTPDPEDPKNYKPAEEGGGVTGTTKPGESGGTTVVNQEELEKINKDKIQATKDRYYKIFGLDNMKKDAVYDSLIDASKIIQEEGGDLKGAVKSGTLQNRIIQAISGQLDKSAALKRQIDAAVLKGEIEKDIKSSDPQAKKRAELIDKQIALADQKLSGGSLIENIQAGAKAQGNINSTSNVYNSILKTYKVEPEVLADTAETLKFRKADNYTTDAALVKSLVEAQGKGAGIYIIDKTAVLIDENGNASTLFQG